MVERMRMRASPNGGKIPISETGTNQGATGAVPNRTTSAVAEAILSAAEQVGEDGRGENGLVGFLRKVAVTQPKTYAALLGRVLPYQIAEEPPKKVFRTVEEIQEELRRSGLPIDRIFREY